MNERKKWLVVIAFAVAMAWVESAVVFDLRTMLDVINPYQPYPAHVPTGVSETEVAREVATLVMLLTVGWLAGRNMRTRLCYAAIGFGVWDIFYYVFLKVICGWPHSLGDWDLLFLLPLPWWGPVWGPVAISALMILGGSIVTQFDGVGRNLWPGKRTWGLSVIGSAVALYVFMADTIRVLPQGARAVRDVLPERFNWLLFLIGLALMAAPVVELTWKARQRKTLSSPGYGSEMAG